MENKKDVFQEAFYEFLEELKKDNIIVQSVEISGLGIDQKIFIVNNAVAPD